MRRRIWFDRKFVLGLPPEAFPDVLERLRGTPARLEERTRDVNAGVLQQRVDQKWTVQEHAGHLLDLEDLWSGRSDDLRRGANTLRPADLTNRKTEEAGHNAARLVDLLQGFRETRLRWVSDLEAFTAEDTARTALHPRLQQPMTIVDLAFFVAEHDDHHLAAITALRDGDRDRGPATNGPAEK
jgi:uncharacterized damage-inducible protein DinB